MHIGAPRGAPVPLPIDSVPIDAEIVPAPPILAAGHDSAASQPIAVAVVIPIIEPESDPRAPAVPVAVPADEAAIMAMASTAAIAIATSAIATIGACAAVTISSKGPAATIARSDPITSAPAAVEAARGTVTTTHRPAASISGTAHHSSATPTVSFHHPPATATRPAHHSSSASAAAAHSRPASSTPSAATPGTAPTTAALGDNHLVTGRVRRILRQYGGEQQRARRQARECKLMHVSRPPGLFVRSRGRRLCKAGHPPAGAIGGSAKTTGQQPLRSGKNNAGLGLARAGVTMPRQGCGRAHSCIRGAGGRSGAGTEEQH